MAVSLDKPAVWSEARGYSVGYLWNYLYVCYPGCIARALYAGFKANDPMAFSEMLEYHFHFDNFTGELSHIMRD